VEYVLGVVQVIVENASFALISPNLEEKDLKNSVVYQEDVTILEFTVS